MKIESHEDDSVTLTAGSITAHIRGDSWKDANDAAHKLGAFIEATYDVNALVRKLSGLREQAKQVARALDAVEHEASGFFAWLDVPTHAEAKGLAQRPETALSREAVVEWLDRYLHDEANIFGVEDRNILIEASYVLGSRPAPETGSTIGHRKAEWGHRTRADAIGATPPSSTTGETK